MTTDFAWLVERGQSLGQGPTAWWTGDCWTTDAYEAARFPTREAATAYIEAEVPMAEAVEHGFVDEDPATWDHRNREGQWPVSRSRPPREPHACRCASPSDHKRREAYLYGNVVLSADEYRRLTEAAERS